MLTVEQYADSNVNERRIADYELKLGKNALLSDINELLKDYNPGGGLDLNVPYFKPEGNDPIAIAYLNRDTNKIEYYSGPATSISTPNGLSTISRAAVKIGDYYVMPVDILAISYGENYMAIGTPSQGYLPSLRRVYGLEHLTRVGPYFLVNCYSLNQPLVIPENMEFLNNNFFQNNSSFSSTIEVNTSSIPSANAFTVSSPNNPAYQKGITLTGPYAQTWKDALPDSDSSTYRKLIIAE